MNNIPSRAESLEVFGNLFFDEVERIKIKNCLKQTAIGLCDKTFASVGAPYWFTDHGPSHSDAVFHYAIKLAQRAQGILGRFSEIEAVALAVSCYLHDLGMAHIPSKFDLKKGWNDRLINQIRTWHVEAPTELLPEYKSNLNDLYHCYPDLECLLPIICKAHGTNSHDKACDELRKYHANNPTLHFRAELIAKLLLVADEMDLSHHRSILISDPRFESFPALAKAHQFKHHYTIAVDADLPAIRVFFGFPPDLGNSVSNAFVQWTGQKLVDQLRLVKDKSPTEYHAVFELFFAPRIKFLTAAKNCSQEITNIVQKTARRYAVSTVPLFDEALDRVNHYLPGRFLPREQGPLYPILDRLVDEFNRGLEDGRASKYFDQLYVRLPQNDRVFDELLARIDRFAASVYANGHRNTLPQIQPFVVAGPTGAGKSAFIQRLINSRRLASLKSSTRKPCHVVYINCLRFGTWDQIARAILEGLADGRTQSSVLKRILSHSRLAAYLKPDRLLALDSVKSEEVLRGLLKTIHLRNANKSGLILPTVIILDNIDRVPGFHTKMEVVSFAAKESQVGFPLFVIPLRYETKVAIDRKRNDLAAIPTHDIRAPNAANVLEARLDIAFRDLRATDGWCSPTAIETRLGQIKLTISDLHGTLEKAIRTLTTSFRPGHEPLIPSIAGTNIRAAQTLYRAIMKSVDVSELVKLAMGEPREHYLIKCAALEGFSCYFAHNSKLRNIFESTIDGQYFYKPYLLEALKHCQHGLQGADYVPLGEWLKRIDKSGLPKSIALKELWELIVGDLPLVEVEGSEENLPQDVLRDIQALPTTTGIRLTSAGRYYMDWLMYDLGYLQCILQDTALPKEMAIAIAQSLSDRDGWMAAVLSFVDYLSKKESGERAAWSGVANITDFTSRIRDRVKKQITSITGRRS